MKYIKNSLIILITILFIGCNLLEEKSVNHEANLQINMGIINRSTILPSISDQDIHYVISFTGDSVIDNTETTEIAENIVLPYGSWSVTVTALDSSDILIASETQEVIIPDITFLSFNLELSQVSSGSVDLSFVISSNLVSDISAKLISTTDESETFLVKNEVNSIYYLTVGDILSGSYILFVDFLDDEGTSLQPPYSSILQVYDSVVTSKQLLIDPGHFESVPNWPGGHYLSEDNLGVVITWREEAKNETGIVVERSIDDEIYEVIDEVDGVNISSYIDYTAENATKYYYRIRYKNNVGLSSPSYFYSNGTEYIITGTGQRIIYVTVDGSGDGSSWENALGDVQEAMDLASSYERASAVWIKTGTYNPQFKPGDTDEADKRKFYYKMYKGVDLYGGFEGIETAIDQRNIKENPTVLSGDFNGNDIVNGSGNTLEFIGNSENAHHVIYNDVPADGEYILTTLDGFTITGGNADLDVSEGSLGKGGGIYTTLPMAIFNTIITGNSALSGGGIYQYSDVFDGSLTISNSVISRNYSSDYGGALYLTYYLIMNNSIIWGNQSRYGGAIYSNLNASSSSAIINIFNSNIINNYATFVCGGIYLGSNDTTGIYNSILWGNVSDDYPIDEEISYYDEDDLIIKNSIVEDLNNTCYARSSYSTESEFLAENLFSGLEVVDITDPDGADDIWFTEDDGFRLLSSSMGIKSIQSVDVREYTIIKSYIDKHLIDLFDRDVLGNERLYNDQVDCGAYETEYYDTTSISNITDITATPGDGYIIFNWTRPVEPDFNYTEVQWEHYISSDIDSVKDDLGEDLLITGLDNDTDYTFTFTSNDMSGKPSDSIEFIASPEFSALQELSNIQKSTHSSYVQLSWDLPADYIFKNIIIENIIGGEVADTFTVDSNRTNYNVYSLESLTEYTFKIRVESYSSTISDGVDITCTTTN